MADNPREVRVRRLESDDDRSTFHSGDIELDRFFQRYAGQNQFRHHIGTTYVALLAEQIVGFVTISVGELATEQVTATQLKRLSAYPLPILRVARLAVEQRFQNLGIGKLLLRAMLELALTLRNEVGCRGVVVDAKSAAVEFNSRLGFVALGAEVTVSGQLNARPEPVPMFLSIQVIAKAQG